MPLPTENYDPNDAHRHLHARMAAEERKFINQMFIEEKQQDLAKIFIQQGFTLLPSEHLRDNEVVVSQAVYDAAKHILEHL